MTATIETVKNEIANMNVSRRERDTKLVAQGQKRSASYIAFFATDYFATVALSNGIDIKAMYELCDKTLNRLELMLKATKEGSFFLRNETDQNRYAFNLIATIVNGHNAKIAMVTRDDVSACGNKRETANEYVKVSSRIMSDSTEKRQVGIALSVLETLGMIETQRVGHTISGYKPIPQSVAFKRFAKMVKAEQAQRNVTA